MGVELTEKFFAEIAGWRAMKEARNLLAGDRVLSSSWQPPLLRGVVQSGSRTLRAGLAIKSAADIENLCPCRESREWGTMCAHSIAVGLHHLNGPPKPAPAGIPAPQRASAAGNRPRSAAAPASASAATPRPAGRGLRRVADPAAGEPIELAVILPPTLDQALGRGRAMVVFEAVRAGKRCPLNALPKERAYWLGPADAELLEAVEALADGEVPAMLQLTPAAFAGLLPCLVGHPRVTLGRDRPVRILDVPWAPPVRVSLERDGRLTLALKSDAPRPRWAGEGWVFLDDTWRPTLAGERWTALAAGPMRLERAEAPGFLLDEWPRWQAAGIVEADFDPARFELLTATPEFHLQIGGALVRLTARLEAVYGGERLPVGSARDGDAGRWRPDPEQVTRYHRRDRAAEAAALERLRAAGFGPPDARGRLTLDGEHAVLNFFARDFPRLEREWRVSLEPRLGGATRRFERIEPRVEVRGAGTQWFELGVAFETSDGQSLPPAEIQRLLRGGQGHVRLRDGRRALLDTGAVAEFEEMLRDCAPEQTGGRYRLRQDQAGFVAATLEAQGWKTAGPSAWREETGSLLGKVRPECPPLGSLDEVLRPYQKAGVAWLNFLRERGWGGVLADEMGLGKTLQTLALLRAVRGGEKRLPPALVICPTSLLFNWAEEARRFVPELRVLLLHGPDRHERFAALPESDLALTSYALARRDLPRLRRLEFDTVVLDEAQHIKNRATQNARAVKALKARHRIVLTGTPLENSVLDLWSIFDFLMPGYLGPAREFRERYEIPITRERDTAVQARLARRLRPFLLRRLKTDVAPELPERIDQVAFCELTPAQRRLYREILEAGRSAVLNAGPNEAGGHGRLIALNALLRLRQICCDPRLLGDLGSTRPPAGASPDVEADDEGPGTSAKLALFNELLAEALDGGHRVLVFSQFTRMLRRLREAVAAQDIPCGYLDGNTRDRAAVVDRFQRGDTPVFLISLKAGGVGLNLTAADTVIHFDPWWNPAVEDQATDRAHRIGQTRRVTSYKLIARDTVEEKILELQRRKRELIRATLAGGEEQLVNTLTWEELRGLFEPDAT